jgi:fucose permease
MSWLHCFWGVGTMIGPVVMSRFISAGGVWTQGYRAISIFQMILTGILLLSLPLWKKVEKMDSGRCGVSPLEGVAEDEASAGARGRLSPSESSGDVTLKAAIKTPGVLSAVLIFLCYCAIESTVGFWATTYMVFSRGIDINLATTWASLFFIGITVGRFITGFISEKAGDKNMIRIGSVLIFFALILMLLPFENKWIVFSSFILAGLGCAPIYPCMIHSTPVRFGKEKSQALIGLQMACAYTGSTLCPPLFGLIVQKISVSLLPFYGIAFLVLMIFLSEDLNRKIK